MLTVEKITKYEDFLKMEPYWDDLLQKSRHNLPFLSFVFIKTEWKHIGWEFDGEIKLTPFILIVKEGEEIIGCFPLVKVRTKYYGLPVTMIRSLGHQHLDRSDMIMLRKHREIIESVFLYFERTETTWNLIFFQNIVELSPLVSYATLPRLSSCACGIKSGCQSPYIKKINTWHEYFRSRSKNFHKRMKNKSNSIRKNLGSIVAREYRTPEEVNAALPIVFAVDARSWKGTEGTALSSTEKTMQYWQTLTENLSKSDRVRMWILWAGDMAIAFEYHVVYNKIVYSMKWSYGKEYHKYSPGLLLKCKSMESFWKDDVVEIDLLGSSDDFKQQWADNKQRSHYNLYFFNRTLYSRIVHFVAFRLLRNASKLKRVLSSLKEKIVNHNRIS